MALKYFKALEMQIKRTKLLMQSLEVSKSCDNPIVEDTCNEIESAFAKAATLLETRRDILQRKKNITGKMETMTAKCNALADRVEEINRNLFPENSYLPNSFESVEQDVERAQNFNGYEVSPTPSTWENGALNTPMPRLQNNQTVLQEEKHIPQIKCLRENEMNSVPSYMKGRITCENINYFIGVLNSVVKQKYSIVNLKRKDVKRKDLIQYNSWKILGEEYKMTGQIFFTPEDLANLANYKLDKTSEKMIQILRHTQRLRQTHVNKKVVLYILLVS